MPEELEFVAVMDRVGGYASYLALRQDARAYDLVRVAIRGEADAEKVQRMERERAGRK